ncbi:hypothetical protein NEIRO03_2322 [Nematocida sp. AWRm78]|nr:hypothetical protein NEIRO02_2303 [Nematocida sp. AWRm79]KAI5186553.1 hypothetical protein NEIRO03_2322 [Nematocida sp. AWRm78]
MEKKTVRIAILLCILVCVAGAGIILITIRSTPKGPANRSNSDPVPETGRMIGRGGINTLDRHTSTSSAESNDRPCTDTPLCTERAEEQSENTKNKQELSTEQESVIESNCREETVKELEHDVIDQEKATKIDQETEIEKEQKSVQNEQSLCTSNDITVRKKQDKIECLNKEKLELLEETTMDFIGYFTTY